MILLDGDAIVYKAGFSSESTIAEEINGKKCRRQDPIPSRDVYPIVDRILRNLKKICEDDEMEIILTDSDIRNNNRYVACRDYKASRGNVVKPVYYSNIRNYLVARYDAEIVTGIEADDELGIRQTDKTIIVSHDKDLFQIPGRHYSLTHGRFLEVSDPGKLLIYRDKGGKARLLGFGFKWFCAQMLMGDDADAIKGLYRYGPVKAFNILAEKKEMGSMWAEVLKHYKESKALDRVDVNALMLWIQRKGYESAFDLIKEGKE